MKRVFKCTDKQIQLVFSLELFLCRPYVLFPSVQVQPIDACVFFFSSSSEAPRCFFFFAFFCSVIVGFSAVLLSFLFLWFFMHIHDTSSSLDNSFFPFLPAESSKAFAQSLLYIISNMFYHIRIETRKT